MSVLAEQADQAFIEKVATPKSLKNIKVGYC
jgi:hypothetical protein